MSDIVERLRSTNALPIIRPTKLEREAADEIERLRGELESAESDGEDMRQVRLQLYAEIERLRGIIEEQRLTIGALNMKLGGATTLENLRAADQPEACLLDEAHVLICQAVAAGNMGNDTPIQTRYAMRQWLAKFADNSAPTPAPKSKAGPSGDWLCSQPGCGRLHSEHERAADPTDGAL